MSELKAIRGGDIHDDVEFVYDDEDRASVLYYLKSEADKVLADLEESHKKEVEQLLIEIVKLKEGAKNLILDNYLNDKQLRHQKYKRCLDKAEWCEERSARYDLLQERTGFSWSREIGFYFKWYQRWLELAEKFKEDYK